MNTTEFSPFAKKDQNQAWRFILNVADRNTWLNKSGSVGKFLLKFLLLLGAGLLVLMILVAMIISSHVLHRISIADIPALVWNMLSGLLLGIIDDHVDFSFMLLGYFVCVFVYFHYKKVSIDVDAQGIQFHGFLFFNIGKSYAWNEFVQIRRSILHGQGHDILVFIDRYGRSFFIRIGSKNPKRGIFFVSDGHALSLLEAVERFYPAPITPLEEAEKRKIPALNFGFGWNANIAGRTAHALVAALGVAVIGFFLHGIPFFLLENWKSHGLILVHWLAAGAGFVLCWRYLKILREKESWETAWITSMLCGAALFFLSYASAPLVPAWLGKERKEVFSVQKREDARQQIWRATRDPDSGYLLFALNIPKEKRTYPPGAEKEFTFRCLSGLCAMSAKEVQSLYLSPKKESGAGNTHDASSRKSRNK